MKKTFIFTGILLLAFSALLFGSDNTVRHELIMENMNLNPLAFTENHGQWDEQVKFKANAGGANMWFTEEGICYQFIRRIANEEFNPDDPFMLSHEQLDQEPDSFEQLVLKASFVGANPNPSISGMDMMEYKCNYFIGNNPDQWHTDIPNYQAVYFEEIYSGIDLKYYGNGKQMEYDFIVSPGTDYTQIQIHYEGAKSLSVNSSGELIVETKWGRVIEQKPYVYQLYDKGFQKINGEYKITGENRFSFKLDDNYNPEQLAVIDPVLAYSTYLGGDNSDKALGIAVDGAGCAYVTGATFSTDFPAVDPYQMYQGEIDIFVTKFSSAGNSLIYSTYLGGGSVEEGNEIAVDGEGNAYVTGHTSSSDFPIVNAYDTSLAIADAFIAKLNTGGNDLIYSTYLGGSGEDYGLSIALDISGNAYVAGWAFSSDFPTVNPYQTDRGALDVFVTKLNSNGNDLIYSTYLGGDQHDWCYRIALDNNGSVYVTGETSSIDFPTVNPYQTNQGSVDVFVTKLNSNGDDLIYSTYVGGSSIDRGYGIAVDSDGNAYITGETKSTDFPTVNPYQTYQDSVDVFVTKLNSNGNGLIYSTYVGGSEADRGYSIGIDINGNGYLIGRTSSIDFPTIDPYQMFQGSNDAFVAKLNTSGKDLIYSTYLGGSDYDHGHDIAISNNGDIYGTGTTYSTDFPSYNQYQIDQADRDVFVVKLTYLCGDANGDNQVNVSDAVAIINYVFVGGDPPDPIESGDANCDGTCNVSDAVAIINYVFVGGNAPCDTDGDGVPDC